MQPGAVWFSRVLIGFAVGLGICLVYLLSAYLLREVWWTSPVAASLRHARLWVWPSAMLDVVFREMSPLAITVILCVINGLTYAVVASALVTVRGRLWLYALLVALVLGFAIWLNVNVYESFSWLGFLMIVVGLGLVAGYDLRARNASAASG